MDRKRLARMLFLAAALVVAMMLFKHWPKDQTVHYVLGSAAPHVEELDARWAPADAKADEPGHENWAREVTFRYAPGQAPRVVTHEPRLADGEYLVEVEMVADNDQTSIVRKHVTLSGGVTQIELAPSVTR